MIAVQDIESTLTDRYQTTVPADVRKALNLHKRDKIHYRISGGKVELVRAESSRGEDPVIGQFLKFLASDMTKHPEHLKAMDEDLVTSIKSLVQNVEVDLDSPLSDDDE